MSMLTYLRNNFLSEQRYQLKCRINRYKWNNYKKQMNINNPANIKRIDDSFILTKDNVFFDINTCDINIMCETETDYHYDGFKPGDVVLDLGGYVGMYSLKILNKEFKNIDHVYIVEPLFIKELKYNIMINNEGDRTTILSYGLGDKDIEILFDRKIAKVKCKTLTQLRAMCDKPITVLKTDCEGGEWCIKPEELDGIRRIEAEVHSFNGKNPQDFVRMLENIGYNVFCESVHDMLMVHAYKNS